MSKTRKRTKWEDKSLKSVIQHVQDKFCNPYIRERDKACFGRCISCNSAVTQAGHRFSVGAYPGMRFRVNNIHGQEISCNHFKSGNLDEYDCGLAARHGKEYLDLLKMDALLYKRNGFKFDKFDVVQVGNTYKYLQKNKIWIFHMREFNDWRDIVNKNF